MSAMFRSAIATPVGPLQLTVDDDGVLVEVLLPNREHRADSEAGSRSAQDGMRTVATQLTEYFEKKRQTFDVPLRPHGSRFEQRVWRRLLEIPYGETLSYGAIATEFEMENGARAVGIANARNPIPIIIPCHRVIGADGSLVGFGGGLPLKEKLLELEGALGLRLPLEVL
ncbi:MAG: methylated-DNA--[protein]-cysteine S-methyltransferase [Vulcanimicrobiaceae bacterium]